MHDVGPQGPWHVPSSWRAALVRVSFGRITRPRRGSRLPRRSAPRGRERDPRRAQVGRKGCKSGRWHFGIRALVVGKVCVFGHSPTLVAGYPLARLVFATTARNRLVVSVAPHRRLLGLLLGRRHAHCAQSAAALSPRSGTHRPPSPLPRPRLSTPTPGPMARCSSW